MLSATILWHENIQQMNNQTHTKVHQSQMSASHFKQSSLPQLTMCTADTYRIHTYSDYLKENSLFPRGFVR